ncbi:MAG: EamA family transporter [Ignavibacteriales bacterium]|nr:EamA family transporter [Ignavibacteriales bacterium]
MTWFLIAFISAFLSALAAIFQKKVLFKESALEFSFLLSIFNLIFALPFLFLADYSTITLPSLFILYGKTILGALAFWCVMLSLKNLEISRALPLLVITPAFVAIFAFVFLSESLNAYQIGGIGLILVGTYILETRNNKELLEPFLVFVRSKKYHYIIFALLFFTTTSIIDKLLLSTYQLPPFTMLGFQQIFFLFNFILIYILAKGKPIKLLKETNKDIYFWIIVIAVITIGYRWTQIEAFKLAPIALVLSIKRISVFFASIVGGKIFKELNLIRKAIATAIMLIGVFLISQNL